jgi:hypothetical protein
MDSVNINFQNQSFEVSDTNSDGQISWEEILANDENTSIDLANLSEADRDALVAQANPEVETPTGSGYRVDGNGGNGEASTIVMGQYESGNEQSCGMATSATQAGHILDTGVVANLQNLDESTLMGMDLETLQNLGNALGSARSEYEVAGKFFETALALDNLDGSSDGTVNFYDLFEEASSDGFALSVMRDGQAVDNFNIDTFRQDNSSAIAQFIADNQHLGLPAGDLEELATLHVLKEEGYSLAGQIGDTSVAISYIPSVAGMVDSAGNEISTAAADGGAWQIELTTEHADGTSRTMKMVNNGDGELSLDDMGINDALVQQINNNISQLDAKIEQIEAVAGIDDVLYMGLFGNNFLMNQLDQIEEHLQSAYEDAGLDWEEEKGVEVNAADGATDAVVANATGTGTEVAAGVGAAAVAAAGSAATA